mmetsp:Transcript_25632/g.61017  ORF Transcript_25632/g.61017 Transcript_25632/m.61017 type:complete len:225 (-) Transcript_25632:213-887(-)
MDPVPLSLHQDQRAPPGPCPLQMLAKAEKGMGGGGAEMGKSWGSLTLAGGRSLRKPSVSTGAHSMRAGPARFAGWGAGRSIIPWVVLDAFHRRSVEPLGRTSRSSHAPVRVVGWYLPWHVSIRGAIWSQVRRDCCYGGTALSASVAVQELRVEVVLLLPLPALMPAMCFMDPRTAKTTWRGWNLLFHTTFLTTPIPADSQVLIIQAAEAATLVPLHPQVVKQAC